MGERSKYNTRQREYILYYLESVGGDHITAADVCEHFRSGANPMGQSTVYRQLERLVDEGVINKYTFDAGSPACFEYIGKGHVKEGTCFHCKCEICGTLIHMHCDELASIGGHLYSEHGFSLDPRRTVFYGICKACSEKEHI